MHGKTGAREDRCTGRQVYGKTRAWEDMCTGRHVHGKTCAQEDTCTGKLKNSVLAKESKRDSTEA